MKWLWNSLIGFALLEFCYSHAFVTVSDALPKEKFETIFFRLYTGNTIEEYIDAHLEEAKTLILDLNITKPTVVYIHGCDASVNGTSVLTVVNAYLNRKDHNVLAVDWSVLASYNYAKVSASVDEIAILVAKALNDIVHAGLPSEKIHVVGHSAGAHVAGFVGLDPGGPFSRITGRRLERSDARFVDIIHTDDTVYGIQKKTGTLDFYPNGGRRIQPGCPTNIKIFTATGKDLTASPPPPRHPMVSGTRVRDLALKISICQISQCDGESIHPRFSRWQNLRQIGIHLVGLQCFAH